MSLRRAAPAAARSPTATTPAAHRSTRSRGPAFPYTQEAEGVVAVAGQEREEGGEFGIRVPGIVGPAHTLGERAS